MPTCPLTISWVCGQPTHTGAHTHNAEEGGLQRGGESDAGASVREGGYGDVKEGGGGGNMDYESVVLMKLRQAEERKRLCDSLASTDGDS